MQIGFALYDYYPFGGLQEDCLATACAVRDRGHGVHIFTRSWKGETPDGIQRHILGKKGWSNTARNEHFFKALAAERKKHSLDALVAFNRIPDADIYFAADPCFVERTKNWSPWRKLGRRYRYYAALEATLFGGERVPETLVLTECEIDAFHRHYAVPRTKFHLLPPGVERVEQTETESQLVHQALRDELGTNQSATVVLFVGSGFRIKGLDRALRAIRANQAATPELEFWIVGNGQPSGFRKLAAQAGVPVRFFGGRADVARFYDAADCLLHPAYSESAGKVLLEALTHGLPVLTTDTCGYAPHILKAKAGAVIESPFSQDVLNQTVRDFIQQPEKRQAMRRNALAYAASEDLYTCHTSAARLIEALLLADKNVRSPFTPQF